MVLSVHPLFDFQISSLDVPVGCSKPNSRSISGWMMRNVSMKTLSFQTQTLFIVHPHRSPNVDGRPRWRWVVCATECKLLSSMSTVWHTAWIILCVQDVTKKCALIRTVMAIKILRLYVFDSQTQQLPSLRTLCPTRWTIRHSAVFC